MHAVKAHGKSPRRTSRCGVRQIAVGATLVVALSAPACGVPMLQVKERRRPRRRLTTSDSRKTERPHRLYPPVFVLTPQRKSERKDRPPFEERNQDVQPPSFDFTQRSKEGDKNVAPPHASHGRQGCRLSWRGLDRRGHPQGVPLLDSKSRFDPFRIRVLAGRQTSRSSRFAGGAGVGKPPLPSVGGKAKRVQVGILEDEPDPDRFAGQ